jgi:coenzyme F420 hydrogenase subunit beta
MERRQKRGLPVPEYGFKPNDIPRERRIFEAVLGSIFWLCSLGVSRWLVEHFPVKITGQLFEQARLAWKRLTRTTKRKGLGHTSFTVVDNKRDKS